jgi:hypothetical protein
MPIASTRTQWDDGLRTVRQFNDLLRVLPPVPSESLEETGAPLALRNAAPSRPLAPAGRAELPQRRPEHDVAGFLGDANRRAPEPVRRDEGRADDFRRPPPVGRNGSQAGHYPH